MMTDRLYQLLLVSVPMLCPAFADPDDYWPRLLRKNDPRASLVVRLIVDVQGAIDTGIEPITCLCCRHRFADGETPSGYVILVPVSLDVRPQAQTICCDCWDNAADWVTARLCEIIPGSRFVWPLAGGLA
jgi:hypothetical protein